MTPFRVLCYLGAGFFRAGLLAAALLVAALLSLATLLSIAILLSIASGYLLIRVIRAVFDTPSMPKRESRTAMDFDALLDELTAPDDHPEGAPAPKGGPEDRVEASFPSEHKERLVALAYGGKTREYLGKTLSAEQIEGLSADEIEKLYIRYESRLGATVTKCIGRTAIRLYAGIAGRFLPIPPEKGEALVSDLEEDPFVEHALNTAACQLYHQFGMWLAALTTASTTLRHCQFGRSLPASDTVVDDASEDGRGDDRHPHDRINDDRTNDDRRTEHPQEPAAREDYEGRKGPQEGSGWEGRSRRPEDEA